jgi:hypothetical protein
MAMSYCILPAGCLYFVMAWVGACVEEGDLGSPKFRSVHLLVCMVLVKVMRQHPYLITAFTSDQSAYT